MNFAISTKSETEGLDHLGIQVDDQSELDNQILNLSGVNISTYNDGETICIHAKSEKSWVTDPNGVAWEAYYTMEEAKFYHGEQKKTENKTACCI